MPSVDPAERDPNRVIVFDTTLRDGEQAPGFSMGVSQKLEMAHALAALGVDVIEAGFAAASPGDEEAVRVVSGEVEGPIFSLSRATEGDILAAHRALSHNRRRRLHIFLGTSPIHRKAKFNMSADEVLAQAVASVQFARTMFDDRKVAAGILRIVGVAGPQGDAFPKAVAEQAVALDLVKAVPLVTEPCGQLFA